MSELSSSLEKILLGFEIRRYDPEAWDQGYRQAIEDLNDACSFLEAHDASEDRVVSDFARNVIRLLQNVHMKRLGLRG